MMRKTTLAVLLALMAATLIQAQTKRQSSVGRPPKKQPSFDETMDWLVDKLRIMGEVLIGEDGVSGEALGSRFHNVRRDGQALCIENQWFTDSGEFSMVANCVKFDDVSKIDVEHQSYVDIIRIHFRHPVSGEARKRSAPDLHPYTTEQISIPVQNRTTSARLKTALMRLVALSGGLKKEPF